MKLPTPEEREHWRTVLRPFLTGAEGAEDGRSSRRILPRSTRRAASEGPVKIQRHIGGLASGVTGLRPATATCARKKDDEGVEVENLFASTSDEAEDETARAGGPGGRAAHASLDEERST